MHTRRALLLSLTASAFVGGARAAAAYPNRTIKIVIPFPPGTPSEAIVRTIADRLSAQFGQPVIVEHRPGGAGGAIGAATVANAEPDGYTLLASPPGPLVTAAALYGKLGYDPAVFAPIALLFESPQLLAAHPGVPAASIPELVAYAKSNPGKLSFASPGYGTQPHLLGEFLKTATGIDIVHVPYRGPAPALTDLLGGQVQLYFETSPLVLPHAQAGNLKILAIASTRRMEQLPDVPTTAESGFAKLIGGFWSAIVAPGGTSHDIITVLNSAINAAMQAPDVKEALAKLGAKAKLGSPDECHAFLTEETRKWTEVIRSAGLKID